MNDWFAVLGVLCVICGLGIVVTLRWRVRVIHAQVEILKHHPDIDSAMLANSMEVDEDRIEALKLIGWLVSAFGAMLLLVAFL